MDNSENEPQGEQTQDVNPVQAETMDSVPSVEPPAPVVEPAPPVVEDHPAPDAPDPLPPPPIETEVEAPAPEPEPVPEPVNAFPNDVGRAGVYIREMGGEVRQMVACSIVESLKDNRARIQLSEAPGVRGGEIVAPYSESQTPGTWHWA